jgi:membrane associated rhomboid family serine protease
MNSAGYNGNGHDRNEELEDDDKIIRLPLQDNRPPPHREPMFNLPPATKYLILALLVIHVAMQFTSPAEQDWIYTHFGFVAGSYTGHAPFSWMNVAAPLTYMLLHGNWLHVGMNSFMLAAFGAGVERLMGATKMLILFVFCGLAAVAVQFAYAPTLADPVIGASGGISGLFAAVLLMMQKGSYVQPGRYGIWPLVIIFIVMQAGFGSSGIGPGGGNIAWVAHIGGFLAGLVLLKPVIRLRFGYR